MLTNRLTEMYRPDTGIISETTWKFCFCFLLALLLFSRGEEEQAVGTSYCESMDDLLRRSDFVRLHLNTTNVTLTGKTRLWHIISLQTNTVCIDMRYSGISKIIRKYIKVSIVHSFKMWYSCSQFGVRTQFNSPFLLDTTIHMQVQYILYCFCLLTLDDFT